MKNFEELYEMIKLLETLAKQYENLHLDSNIEKFKEVIGTLLSKIEVKIKEL